VKVFALGVGAPVNGNLCGTQLCFNHDHLDNEENMLKSLGITFTHIVKEVPDGIMILFQSYNRLYKFVDICKTSGVW
jgi:Rad3-related DNA helicase